MADTASSAAYVREGVNKTNAAPSSATKLENEGTVSPSVAVEGEHSSKPGKYTN